MKSFFITTSATVIPTAITVGLLAFPYLWFLWMSTWSTPEDTAYHLDLWQNILDRYRLSMHYHEDFPTMLGYVEPGQSMFSVAQHYGLDGHMGLDFLTYAIWVIDVRTAIEISGDVQLALDLANDIVNRLDFHRSHFNDFASMFLEHQLTLISTGATRLQELLSDDLSSYMQNPELIASIDELLNQIFVGYASGLETWMVDFLQDRVPQGTTDHEVYNFLITRINTLQSHSPGDWFLLRPRTW